MSWGVFVFLVVSLNKSTEESLAPDEVNCA